MSSNNTQPKPVEVNSVLQSLLEKVEAIERHNKELEKRLEDKEKAIDAQSAKMESFLKPDVQAVEQVRGVRENKKDIMRRKLAEQPTVRTYLPLTGNEKTGDSHPVTINGLRINVPKGVYVDLPQQVADILRESFQQTENAGKAFRLDLKKGQSKEGVTTEMALS